MTRLNFNTRNSCIPLAEASFPVKAEALSPRERDSRKETLPPLFQGIFLPPQPAQTLLYRVLPFLFPAWGIYLISRKIAKKCLLALVESYIGPLGKCVFPAPKRFEGAEKIKWQSSKKKMLDSKKNKCSPLQIKAADGVKLDGVVLWKSHALMNAFKKNPDSIDFSGQKWIVCFNGNAMCYEQCLRQMGDLRDKTGHNVIAFNYRGVMDSDGVGENEYKEEDLILDGDTFIQYLLSRGVRSEDILVHGYSLGGGVGTQVRALHPEGPIANYQSFSSIAELVAAIARSKLMNGKGKNSSWLADKCADMIGYIASGLLEERGWALDSADKWGQIKGYKWIVTADKDALIIGRGRLYKAVKQQLEGYVKVDKSDPKNREQLELNKKLKRGINHVSSRETGHCEMLTKEAYAQHLAHIKKALLRCQD